MGPKSALLPKKSIFWVKVRLFGEIRSLSPPGAKTLLAYSFLAYFGGPFSPKVHFLRNFAFWEQRYGLGATFPFLKQNHFWSAESPPGAKWHPEMVRIPMVLLVFAAGRRRRVTFSAFLPKMHKSAASPNAKCRARQIHRPDHT